MKKVICGKLYDTDKARWLGSAEGGEGIDGWEETLCRKRTGEFFLFGVGGPMSRYAVSIGQNEWSGGEKIIPLSPQNARAWAEEHLGTDEYERIFGVPDEDAEPVMLSVLLPADLSALIRQKAAEKGISLTAYVEWALRSTL